MINDFRNNKKIEEIVAENDIVILQFSSITCQPCTAIRQRIDAWQNSHSSVEAWHISIDEYPEMAAQNQVLTFPTVVVYVDGKEAIHESGYFSLDDVLARVERYIELMG